MRRVSFLFVWSLIFSSPLALAQSPHRTGRTYLGFDRNDYPGDKNMAALRRTFTFTGYWLNNPPGQNANTWAGKRAQIEKQGYGFLVLFNGRSYASVRNADPAATGKADGTSAVKSARREGFPTGTVLFLDQEEGGRLLPEQRAYIHGWMDAVTASGYRAGVYCSGVAFREGDGSVVVTADDIRKNAGTRKIVFWVSNDACPPSPGCTTSEHPAPGNSGLPFADVWQYAQSPRRKEMTAACAKTYSLDEECYPPGFANKKLHVDLNVATTPDPSHGRRRH